MVRDKLLLSLTHSQTHPSLMMSAFTALWWGLFLIVDTDMDSCKYNRGAVN